jgi:hypothetical protein
VGPHGYQDELVTARPHGGTRGLAEAARSRIAAIAPALGEEERG